MSYYVRVIVLLAVLFGLIVWAHPVQARSLAIATQGSVSVTVTDEPCSLKAVSNMPNRSIWRESGKTYEGCFLINPMGLIVAYFDDKTVAVIPVQHFKPVSEM